jgi:hypothetical protein
MRRKYIVWLVVLLSCFYSCSNAQKSTGSNKILIVYLSRTYNTKAVAEMIHKNLGGTLVSAVSGINDNPVHLRDPTRSGKDDAFFSFPSPAMCRHPRRSSLWIHRGPFFCNQYRIKQLYN